MDNAQGQLGTRLSDCPLALGIYWSRLDFGIGVFLCFSKKLDGQIVREIGEIKQTVDCISRDNIRNAYIGGCQMDIEILEFSITFSKKLDARWWNCSRDR